MTAPVGAARALDVRRACTRVASLARHVRIDGVAVDALAGSLAGARPPAWSAPHLDAAAHGAEATAAFTMALSALNFSFWEDEPRWRVGGEDGYAALARALRRAHDAGTPVADPRAVASWTVADVAGVLHGDAGGPPAPPLLAERHAVLRDTARWLVDEHGGSAPRALRAAASAPAFAAVLATALPRWRDVADYRGLRVPLLKRAQICVHDCVRALGTQAPPGLRDLGGLTAFADYKVPQVLRAEGVLVYAPRLADMVDARREMHAGCEEEVEIRALTVVAVDRLVATLHARGDAGVCAADVDGLLWWRGRDAGAMPPYHRVRSIWY